MTDKTYEVSWIEHEACEITVRARNKKEAKQMAIENFPDSREWLKSTDWEIKRV